MNQPQKKRVLFVCLGNACRSPMAESIALRDAQHVMEVSSGGLYPLGEIPPMTLQTLQQNGYSVDSLHSKPIARSSLDTIDVIVNMSGQFHETAFPGSTKVVDWVVNDPYGGDAATYQATFDDIRRRVLQLAESLAPSGSTVSKQ